MKELTQTPTLGQRWSASRPTKTALFWSCVASAILTMVIGFTWGGWVREATARNMAEVMAEEAVVKHLAPICAARFGRDPAKSQKLKQLKELSSYERADYVKKQGWANMPGDEEPDTQVADACAGLIVQ